MHVVVVNVCDHLVVFVHLLWFNASCGMLSVLFLCGCWLDYLHFSYKIIAVTPSAKTPIYYVFLRTKVKIEID